MVNKSKIIILSIFIFSLAFFLSFTVFPKNSLACHLAGPDTYYRDDQCTQSVNAYDFAIDLGGCVMGYSAGQLHPYYCDEYGSCYCLSAEAKWYTSPSSDGQVCKRRCGAACDVYVKEGKWDSFDSRCVVCNGAVETGYFDSSNDYSGDYKCESACGADPACDEKDPDKSLPDSCGTTQLNVSRYCDGSCKYSLTTYTCDSSKCGDVKSCGGQTYYCVYDNGWKWSTSKPSNFCCNDTDCSGYDPTTHTKYVCECPDSSRCSITGSSYTCKPKGKCSSNSDCDSGWCCDYSVGGTGSCRQMGTITSYGGRSYLCDPPEGFVNSSNEEINTNTQGNKKLTLLDLLINPFYYFFIR